MKKVHYIICSIITIAIVILSCESVDDPVITDFSLVNDSAKVNTNTEFNIAGDADQFIIWTGDAGKSYYAYLEQTDNPNDTVIVVKDYDKGAWCEPGIFTYRYTSVDTTIAVLIATNIGDEGNEIKQVRKEIDIIVY